MKKHLWEDIVDSVLAVLTQLWLLMAMGVVLYVVALMITNWTKGE